MKQNEVEKIEAPQEWNRQFAAYYSELVSAAEIEERQLSRALSQIGARAVAVAIEAGLLPVEAPPQSDIGSYSEMARALEQADSAAIGRAVAKAPMIAAFLLAQLKIARHAMTLQEWDEWNWAAMGAVDAIDWSDDAMRAEYSLRFGKWVLRDDDRCARWVASGLAFDDLFEK